MTDPRTAVGTGSTVGGRPAERALLSAHLVVERPGFRLVRADVGSAGAGMLGDGIVA